MRTSASSSTSGPDNAPSSATRRQSALRPPRPGRLNRTAERYEQPLPGLFEPGARHLVTTRGGTFARIVNVEITPVVLGLVVATDSSAWTAR